MVGRERLYTSDVVVSSPTMPKNNPVIEPAAGNFFHIMSEGKAAADDDAHSSADDTEDTSEKFGNTSLTNAELRVDDEAWAPMGGREQAYFVQLITQQISYFADKPLYDGRCSIGDYAARFLAQPEAYGWTLDFDPNLFCELAYEGFLSTGMEMPAGQDAPLQILLPWIDPKRNSLDFEDMHISKQVRGRRRRRRKRRRRRSRRSRKSCRKSRGTRGETRRGEATRQKAWRRIRRRGTEEPCVDSMWGGACMWGRK